MNKIAVLSGGLDSTILTYKMVKDFGKENVIALTYNYGQRHNIEVKRAEVTGNCLGIKHQIIDISFLGKIIENVSALSNSKKVEVPNIKDVLGDPQPPTYVPFRNQILLSIALAFAESNNADEVYYGAVGVDEYGYWDTTTYFLNALNAVADLNRLHKIQIKAPFISLKKVDEIKLGIEIGVPFEHTWSCYTGDAEKGACGICPTCSERIMNFMKAGIKDPIKYQTNINWEKGIKENKI